VMESPNLPPLPRLSPLVYSNLPKSNPYTSRTSILKILDQSGVSPRLQSSFIDLDRLTHTLNHAITYKDIVIDPRSLDEDIVQIHHDILSLLIPETSSQDSSHVESPVEVLNEAAGIAALLYAKSITRPIYSIPKHPRPIVQRLISSLSQIDAGGEILNGDSSDTRFYSSRALTFVVPAPPATSFLIWVHFIGGLTSRGLEADFLADGIRRLISRCKCDGDMWFESWEGLKIALCEILWFPLVHDEPGKRLWEMAMEETVVEEVDRIHQLE